MCRCFCTVTTQFFNEKIPHFCLHKPQSSLLGGFVDKEQQQQCVLRWQLAQDRVAFAAQLFLWLLAGVLCPRVFQCGCSMSDVTKELCDCALLTETAALGISWCLAPGTL